MYIDYTHATQTHYRFPALWLEDDKRVPDELWTEEGISFHRLPPLKEDGPAPIGKCRKRPIWDPRSPLPGLHVDSWQPSRQDSLLISDLSGTKVRPILPVEAYRLLGGKADVEQGARRALASTPWSLAPRLVAFLAEAHRALGGEDSQGPDALRSRAGVCALVHEQKVLDEIECFLLTREALPRMDWDPELQEDSHAGMVPRPSNLPGELAETYQYWENDRLPWEMLASLRHTESMLGLDHSGGVRPFTHHDHQLSRLLIRLLRH